jgi:adenosylcobinamide-phosphate synthase
VGTSLFLAVAIDRLFGEPPAHLHPVVWIGRLIAFLDRRAPEQGTSARLAYGALLTALTCAAAAGPAWAVQRAIARLPALPGALLLAVALKPAFAWRALKEHVVRVLEAIERSDLPAARDALSMIVSRRTADLDGARVAAGAIESLAENLSDSLVAPLCWYAVGGLPAVWLYRASNTLDAMVGYRTERYELLGKTAARLDDALNWLPSRLTAVLFIACAPLAGADRRRALEVLRRDGGATASPNAGRPMAAMAGALGVELEKVGHYRLGGGLPLPEPEHLRRALALTRWAASAAVLACALSAGARRGL